MNSQFLAAAAVLLQPASAPTPLPPPSSPLFVLSPGSSTYLDVDAGVGYATNPLLDFRNNTGRVFGRLGLRAVHARRSARAATIASAVVENTTYLGRYGSQLSLRLDARHDLAVSETFRVFGNVYASSDRGDQLGTRAINIPEDPDVPLPEVIPILPVPVDDLSSLFGRQYRLGGNIGGQRSISPRDNVIFTAGYERVFFRNSTFDRDRDVLSASLGWDRRLSPRATAGARLSARRTNFDAVGDTLVVTPQLTGTLQLSERSELSGAVGVSHARIDNGVDNRSSTGLYLQGRYCRRGEQDRLCAQVSRDHQVATNTGPVNSLRGGVNYSRRLNETDTFDLAVAASRNSATRSTPLPLLDRDRTYFSGSATYARQLSGRWFAGANVAARKFVVEGPDPNADLRASIFMRYRFGDQQ